MANEIGGAVIWDLDVNKQKLTSGLASARQEINSFASTADKNFSTLSKSITSSMRSAEADSQKFVGGVSLIGAGLFAAGGFAIKSAGDMEMLRSSLDTLTGSAEKGSRVFQDLNTFAAKTPFQTDDLAKATQTMLAFGITAEDALPNLRVLGDISQGNQEKLRGLTLAFSQVASTGRLMGQDLLQMINQGFNPLTIISQKTGRSMADLKEEMADGLISFDMVKDAMVTATSEGGLFFKGMERGAATLPGIWSTLMDTIGMTTRQLVGLSQTGEIISGGLVDQFKQAVTGLTSFLADNQAGIVDFFNTTLGWITDNGPVIVGIIVGGITPAVYGLGAAFLVSLGHLLPFIAAGAALGVGIKLIVDALGGWQQAQIKIGEAMGAFTNAFNTHVKPALDSLVTQISVELMPALRELWTIIGPVLGPVLKALAVVLGTIVIGALRLVIEVLKSVIQSVTQNVENFTGLVNFFKGMAAAISGALSGVKDAITKPFSDAWASVSKIADNIKGSLDKISPYHRNSPSLVDNVKSGVGLIMDEYASLKNITLPSLSGLAPSLEYQPAFTSVGTETEPSSVSSGGNRNQYITFEQVNVRDEADIDSITRELGFMTTITPGFIE